jgi:hypothetical protein
MLLSSGMDLPGRAVRNCRR